MPPPWLDSSELRVGLGCMRLGDDAADTIGAALEAGISVFDTARAYEGGERRLAEALKPSRNARIVTKGGMSRPQGRWVPDGRAKAIHSDCEASLTALAGRPIDLYLLHAPDPRTPWATSVRALGRLLDQGLVRRIGIANVNRRQLDEALELAPISAVQCEVSLFDDRILRGGILERCLEADLALIAHSPLGGPRRARRLAVRPELARIAAAHQATAAEVALAWLLGISPNIVVIPGATRSDSARSAARAATLSLRPEDRAALVHHAPPPPPPPPARTPRPRARPAADAEVVVVMGIPGAGKSRVAREYVSRGYTRLNRDERGGPLRAVAAELEEVLAAGVVAAVLDNTYLTRAARSYVVEVARRHRVASRCLWLDTPLAQAQVNLVLRLVERFGRLPTPEEVRAASRRAAGLMAPTSQMRALRELEPPSGEEGFDRVERLAFTRAGRTGRAGVFLAAAAIDRWDPTRVDAASPHLIFDWRPGAAADALEAIADSLRARVVGPVSSSVCPHGGGPPICWCRPPLPGLPLAFAQAHDIDPSRSVLIGTSPAHRTLAATLGARFESSR